MLGSPPVRMQARPLRPDATVLHCFRAIRAVILSGKGPLWATFWAGEHLCNRCPDIDLAPKNLVAETCRIASSASEGQAVRDFRGRCPPGSGRPGLRSAPGPGIPPRPEEDEQSEHVYPLPQGSPPPISFFAGSAPEYLLTHPGPRSWRSAHPLIPADLQGAQELPVPRLRLLGLYRASGNIQSPRPGAGEPSISAAKAVSRLD